MLKKRSAKGKNAAAPAGKRIYAIGDIHGCREELDDLLALIAEEESDAGRQLVFLGDYVDRGPDSRGVLDRLIELKRDEPDAVFLKGNHEAVMLDFLDDPDESYHWLDWGGQETLESYGVTPVLGRESADLAKDLQSKMPKAHISFLKALPLTHIEGDYLFVHAGLRPGVALEDQDEEDLLWIRKRFHKASANERPDKVVVHGHHPHDKPLDAGWRIAVDTGACWTGRLTAVVLEGKSRRFLST